MRRLASKRPLLLAQSPREQNSLRVRKAAPELDIVSIRISVAREPAHGQLRRARLMLVLVGHSPIIVHRETRRNVSAWESRVDAGRHIYDWNGR
jgi:hypothetical protein